MTHSQQVSQFSHKYDEKHVHMFIQRWCFFPEMLKKLLPFKTYYIERGRVYNFCIIKKDLCWLKHTYVARFLMMLVYLILSFFPWILVFVWN